MIEQIVSNPSLQDLRYPLTPLHLPSVEAHAALIIGWIVVYVAYNIVKSSRRRRH